MTITVLYNTPANDDPSEQDTKKSAEVVFAALKNISEFSVELLGIDPLEINKIKDLKSDLVFNLTEWTGLDTKYAIETLEALESAKIKYTGSHKLGIQITNDKTLMKREFTKLKISSPKYQIYATEFVDNDLQFPVIVKLALEHCSIGIDQTSVVVSADGLRSKILDLRSRYDMPVLAEEFIEGDEIHAVVLSRQGQPWVLPPARIKFQDIPGVKPILTHEAKWASGAMNSDWADFEEYSPSLKLHIIDLAKRSFLGLGGRSYTRIDMRVSGNNVYVLEVNNNPGIDWDPDNALHYCAQKAGFLTFEQLLTHIVHDAVTY